MKKILLSFAVLAVSAAAIITVNVNNSMDEQFEANVEALAGGEDPTHGRWRTVGCGSYSFSDWKTYCCPSSEWNNCPGLGDCTASVIFGCE